MFITASQLQYKFQIMGEWLSKLLYVTIKKTPGDCSQRIGNVMCKSAMLKTAKLHIQGMIISGEWRQKLEQRLRERRAKDNLLADRKKKATLEKQVMELLNMKNYILYKKTYRMWWPVNPEFTEVLILVGWRDGEETEVATYLFSTSSFEIFTPSKYILILKLLGNIANRSNVLWLEFSALGLTQWLSSS